MENRNAKFSRLLDHACSVFGQSADQLKEKYNDYPVCLLEYIDKGAQERVLEVRFDTDEATISISFDDDNNADTSFLFFDTKEDEEKMIDHLIDSADYDFRKSSFKLPSCSLKIQETRNETYFFVFR